MGAAAPAQRWPGGAARALRKSARGPLGRRRPQVPSGRARPRLLPPCCGLAAVAAPRVGPARPGRGPGQEGRRREGSGAASRDREGPRLAPCAAVRCLLPVLWEPAAAVGPSRCLRVSAGGGRREERGAGTQLLGFLFVCFKLEPLSSPASALPSSGRKCEFAYTRAVQNLPIMRLKT